jgi:pantoate--beta-alanine ligase
MKVFSEIAELQSVLRQAEISASSIGLVPTMGALHQGHLSLISASKQNDALTVCSIYVNPAQFNNPADLEKYPRTLEQDIALLRNTRCDVLFVPSNSTMYPAASDLKLDFGMLDKVYEGQFRPGHFSGVGLVVSKLFNIVRPTRAYFGQKDFQQLAIIKKLAAELFYDIDIKGIATVREPNGLAMSSRNLRLSAQQKEKATIFHQTLLEAREQLLLGNPWQSIRLGLEAKINDVEEVRLEYMDLVDAINLKPLETVNNPQDKAVILIAGYVGDVRLIDNLLVNE